jgi:hypothetical protein
MNTNIVLISSPLQALVFWLILNSDIVKDNNFFYVYLEGNLEFPSKNNCIIHNVHDTRGVGQKYINCNLDLIVSTDAVKLWISDPFWPMNNAIYTKLKIQNKLLTVNYFDEGLVLYWQWNTNIYRLFREYSKSIYLKIWCDINYTQLGFKPFISLSPAEMVFAIHPNLLNIEISTQKIDVDEYYTNQFTRYVERRCMVNQANNNIHSIQGNSLFFLSQPYYRISSTKAYLDLLLGLRKYIYNNQFSEIFIKLHPSESEDDFNMFYRDMGFQLIKNPHNIPIESYMSILPRETTLLSFNSSALLNSRVFGFRGQVVSYGLDWISQHYKYDKNLLRLQTNIFNRNNIDIISYQNYAS